MQTDRVRTATLGTGLLWGACFCLALVAPAARADPPDIIVPVAVTKTEAVPALAAFFDTRAQLDDEGRSSIAFLERVARDAQVEVVRAQALYLLASARAHAFDFAAADKNVAALGLLQRARMIGPFPNTGGAAFGSPTPADDLTAMLDARVAGAERQVAYQDIQASASGVLDVGAQMNTVNETRARLVVAVRAPRAMRGALRVGSTGQVRALINGVEVLRVDTQRALALDQDAAPIALAAGLNLVELELGFLRSSGTLLVRFTDADGKALSGLSVQTTTPALQAAWRGRAAAARRSAQVPPLTRPLVDVAAALRSTREAPVGSTPGAREQRAETLRQAAAVEEELHTGDVRARPPLLLALRAAHVDASTGPARAGALARLGQAELNATVGADATAAASHFNAALALDADNVRARVGLAQLRETQGRAAEAFALLQQAAARAPTSDAIAVDVLRLWRNDLDGSFAAALPTIARAQKPGASDAALDLGADVLQDAGDVAGALALLSRMENQTRAKGLALELLTRTADTAPQALVRIVAGLREQLRLWPARHEVAEQLAMALLHSGKQSEAAAFLADRRRLYPERPEPYEASARVLARVDAVAARAFFAEALAQRPQDGELRRALRTFADDAQGDDLALRYGIDALALQNAPTPDGAARAGAAVLASTVAVRFFDNGLSQTLDDRVFRIVDARRARGLQVLTYAYTEGREQLDVLRADRIAKDGSITPATEISDLDGGGKSDGMYTDVAYRRITLPALQDGDLVHIRLSRENRGDANLFGDFFGHSELVQSVLPVERWSFVVEAPTARKLFVGGKGAPAPEVSVVGGRTIYAFHIDSAPPLQPEPNMPPFPELAQTVTVSTYATWAELGAWYERFSAPQLKLDDTLRAVARDLVAHAHNREELVRNAYELVISSTRYVGIELGVHGWKPYPVTEVFRRRFGDCKDKASLLVALLREAGVAANLTLVRTNNLGVVAGDVPSMWTFNHAIAYVPELDLFLDGTAEASGYRELPTMDQGALALVVGAHGTQPASELRTLPVSLADENMNLSDYVLALDAEGTMQVTGRERFTGKENPDIRRVFMDAATRAQRLSQQLSAVLKGAVVTSVVPTSLALREKEVGYDFTATLPRRALADADADGTLTMPLSLYPHDLVGSYGELSRRTYDVNVPVPWRTRNVMRYVLPPGVTVEQLPAGGTVNGKHLHFVQRVTVTPDGFIVDEDTAILARRIPAAEYEAFRRDAVAADALMKRTLRLRRGKP